MKNSDETTSPHVLNILLADDDFDDCLLFTEALKELQLQTKLRVVHDGDQLMQLLTKNTDEIFDVLFLDLNMPRKNGFRCLEEIKSSSKLKSLPVIILSTSFHQKDADMLYEKGAKYYISKPANFQKLRQVIQEMLSLVSEKNTLQTVKESSSVKV